jgi:hypothetical protein
MSKAAPRKAKSSRFKALGCCTSRRNSGPRSFHSLSLTPLATPCQMKRKDWVDLILPVPELENGNYPLPFFRAQILRNYPQF